MRVKTSTVRRQKHKKVRQQAKGFRGARGRRIKQAKEGILHALSYQHQHRRLKKRQFRQLWIIRLNAALRNRGLIYSEFINKMKSKGIELDRKILAQIAFEQPKVFDQIVEKITT